MWQRLLPFADAGFLICVVRGLKATTEQCALPSGGQHTLFENSISAFVQTLSLFFENIWNQKFYLIAYLAIYTGSNGQTSVFSLFSWAGSTAESLCWAMRFFPQSE